MAAPRDDAAPVPPPPAGDPVTWTVGPEDEGARLDAWLAERVRALGHSRADLLRWLEETPPRVAVRRDGRPLRRFRKALPLRAGDELALALPPPAPPASPLAPEALPLAILWQDDALLVLDKPAGMSVHPGAGRRGGTLAAALLHAAAGRLSTVGGPDRPGIVHRLDKDTSGVIVVARTDAAHRALARQFHDRTVEKTYLALVAGRPPDAGEVALPIGRDPRDRKRMAPVEGGRPARTRFRVVERFRRHALLEVRPETGRTHQIRVHLKAIGAPLVADATYGRKGPFTARDAGAPGDPAAPLLARHALHAARLAFDHPETGARLAFEAPLPDDLARALDALRRAGAGAGPAW